VRFWRCSEMVAGIPSCVPAWRRCECTRGLPTLPAGRQHLNEWIEVVPPALLAEGQATFASWLREHKLSQEQISPDDIRVDVIRTRDGGRMRYLVRRETLARLGVAI